MKPEVVIAIERETIEARMKHGASFEEETDDGKLRILVEEVGDIARAIQDLANAERARQNASVFGTTDELEEARRTRDAARKHLMDEVTQVTSLGARWLEVGR